MTTVYHAILYDQAGYLARIDRALTFLDRTTDALTEIEPEMFAFCHTLFPMPDAFAPGIIARMRGCHEYLNCQMGS
jgi:hypothetical protein